MRQNRHEVIVVGVGGIGSATTYHLAERGVDVLGLERFDVPNRRGSSHGTRSIVPSGCRPDLVSLQRRAHDRWDDLQTDYDGELLRVTGSLGIGRDEPQESDENEESDGNEQADENGGADGNGGPNGDPESEAGQPFEDELRACRAADLDHDVLDADELSDRFPAYDVPDGYRAVFQPAGGFLDAESGVTALVETATDRGAEIHARERVCNWQSTAEGVRVRTDRDDYEADALVVTAGAWTPGVVDDVEEVTDGVGEFLSPARRVTGRFQPTSPSAFEPDAFPVFSLATSEGQFRGRPKYRVPGVEFEFEEPIAGPIDPDVRTSATHEDEAKLRPVAEKYLPEADGPVMGLTTTLLLQTPDRLPILDTLPDADGVVVGAGFSDLGLELAPAFGELLADLALDDDPEEVDPFRLSRFE